MTQNTVVGELLACAYIGVCVALSGRRIEIGLPACISWSRDWHEDGGGPSSICLDIPLGKVSKDTLTPTTCILVYSRRQGKAVPE